MDQRNSVWVGIGGRRGSRGWETYGDAHWIGGGGDRGIVVDAGGVERVQEINQSVVYEFFEVVDELTNCAWYFSRVIPPENVNDGALIDRVIRIDDLWGGEAEEGIDGNKDDANGIVMNGTSPLKMMVSADEEGGSNVSFPKGREGAVIRLVD